MFSWLCRGCSKSILNARAVSHARLAWMTHGVFIRRESPSQSTLLSGVYEGEGRVGSISILNRPGDKVEAYHARCWEMAGEPRIFTVESSYAPDMGQHVNVTALLKHRPRGG